MGFAVELTDGSKVEIVATKRDANGRKVLIDALGNKYLPSLSPLKIELIEAAQAVEAGVESVGAELTEASEEIGDAIGDAVEEVGDAVEAAVESISEEVGEAIDAAQVTIGEMLGAAEELIEEPLDAVKDLLDGDGEEAPPAP